MNHSTLVSITYSWVVPHWYKLYEVRINHTHRFILSTEDYLKVGVMWGKSFTNNYYSKTHFLNKLFLNEGHKDISGNNVPIALNMFRCPMEHVPPCQQPMERTKTNLSTCNFLLSLRLPTITNKMQNKYNYENNLKPLAAFKYNVDHHLKFTCLYD